MYSQNSLILKIVKVIKFSSLLLELITNFLIFVTNEPSYPSVLLDNNSKKKLSIRLFNDSMIMTQHNDLQFIKRRIVQKS